MSINLTPGQIEAFPKTRFSNAPMRPPASAAGKDISTRKRPFSTGAGSPARPTMPSRMRAGRGNSKGTSTVSSKAIARAVFPASAAGPGTS